jgi:hypothetical protein
MPFIFAIVGAVSTAFAAWQIAQHSFGFSSEDICTSAVILAILVGVWLAMEQFGKR